MFVPRIKPTTQKRLEQLVRGQSTKRYQNWRKTVLARDEEQCQFPSCKSKEKLEIHHIRRFADAIHLRHQTYNGITLCEKHHRMITGHEKFYELMLFKITAVREKEFKTKNNGGQSGTGTPIPE